MLEVLSVHIERAGYPDAKDILKNIRFHVSKGELVGLIGANGSGKSTTMKCILHMLADVKGTILFKDESKKYAYIPESPSYYDELTLWEHLQFAATVSELEEGKWQKRAHQLVRDFRMEHVIHHFPSSFSKGMQQKLMIIVALLMEPLVYIVDEPFIGLDPKAIRQFLTYIHKEKERRAGILMSTHVLDTAEKYCDRLLLIENGEIRAEGTMDEIRQLAGLPNGSLMDCFDRLMEW